MMNGTVNTIAKVLSTVALILYYVLEGIVLAFIPRKFRFKDVKGETVLITGGGSGIGRLLALRFAKLGSRIILLDVNTQGNEETVRLVKEIGGEAHPYYCDVADRKQVYEVAARIKDEVGKVTILINNAGIVTGKRFLDSPDEKIIQTFEVNTLSHFWTCKAFLPDMIAANHGHIVEIASLAGINGTVRLSDYCASKFAVVGFEESLRLELATEGHTGIHSTVICPYFINTGMFKGVNSKFIPILEQEDVADEIVAAVLSNQEIVYIPKIFYLLNALKTMVPFTAFCTVYYALGGHTTMNQFVGHKNDMKTKS